MKLKIILTVLVLIFLTSNISNSTPLFSDGKHVSATENFIPIDENQVPSNRNNNSIRIEIKKDKELSNLLEDEYALKRAVVQDSVLTEINGYRIQIYITDEFEKAKSKVEIYSEMFKAENVKLDFEEPYFKIRVGNLRDKDKAEAFKEKLKNMGFRNLYIVPARVMVKMPKKK